MPTFKIRKSNKGIFSEENLNKALNDVRSNKMSLRKASQVYEIPLTTLHRYKKNLNSGETEIKKLTMVTTQVSSLL